MNELKQERYDFHFIMDREMKNELMGLGMFYERGSFSGLIVDILGLLLPRIEGEHFYGDERLSRYEVVNENMEVMRESVHVYMPGDLYRRFKLMHQDLNVYSMAQLVRFFLGWFLCVVRVYGEDALDVIMKQCEEKNKRKCISIKQIRQLLQFIYKKTANNRLLNIYNHKFSPIRILRI